MSCSDLQENISLYGDGLLSEAESAVVAAHLETCPLCRQRNAELHEMRSRLARISRPQLSGAVRQNLKAAVAAEARRRRAGWLPLGPDVREWLQMQVMPYSVGAVASVVIGFVFLSAILSGSFRYEPPIQASTERSLTLAANYNPYSTASFSDISPAELVRSRFGFSSESPSINPQGALVALTDSLVGGRQDEVVVVADVDSAGLAQIAEVVEPPKSARVANALEKALDSGPSNAPFVPASMEQRPESVRVVLRFQSVDVPAPSRRRR